jgi:penicillin-binding protein 1A
MSISQFIKHGFFAFISLAMTAIIGVAILIVCLESQLPDVTSLKDVDWQIPLTIYTQDGKLIGQFGAERRTPISINEVPKELINAILATEDQRFFEHVGIDPWGIARATFELILTGKKVQGGSTITMQVARNYFLTSEKTFSRKIREILLAIKIDRAFPKDKILELYLNKIYFGNRAYGVAAAAQLYYGKSLKQLTLPELAMLAGIPKAPSQLNPLADKAAAQDRRDHVLQRMFQLGFITKVAYDNAVATPLTAIYRGAAIDNEAPYVAEMVRDALYAHFGQNTYTQGYIVYTTIDSRLQKAANEALKKAVVSYNKRHNLMESKTKAEGAIVALNPQSGALLALDGGLSYEPNVNPVQALNLLFTQQPWLEALL